MKYTIRIAVAIDKTGSWNASGWGDVLEEINAGKKAMDIAIDGTKDGEKRYWIEAEIELPTEETIKGEAHNEN